MKRRRTNRLRNGSQGFTLIELLVALAVLGLLTALGAGLLHLGAHTSEKTAKAAEAVNQVEAVQALLRHELREARPVMVKDKDTGAAFVAFDGTPEAVAFDAPLPAALGGQAARLRFFVERTDDGQKNRWWVGELAWFLPAALKRRIAARKSVFVITLGNGGADIARFAGREALEIRQIPAAELETLPDSAAPCTLPALVVLAPDYVQFDRLRMPSAARGRLRQALSFEAARRSPFPVNEMLFDFAVIGEDAGDRSLEIECAMAPAGLVHEAQRTARKLGFCPVAVGLTGETGNALRYVFATERLPWSGYS